MNCMRFVQCVYIFSHVMLYTNWVKTNPNDQIEINGSVVFEMLLIIHFAFIKNSQVSSFSVECSNTWFLLQLHFDIATTNNNRSIDSMQLIAFYWLSPCMEWHEYASSFISKYLVMEWMSDVKWVNRHTKSYQYFIKLSQHFFPTTSNET